MEDEVYEVGEQTRLLEEGVVVVLIPSPVQPVVSLLFFSALLISVVALTRLFLRYSSSSGFVVEKLAKLWS